MCWHICVSGIGGLAVGSASVVADRRRRRVALAGDGTRPQGRQRGATILRAAPTVVALENATVRCGAEVVLDDVDLEVPKGARCAILGPNGCGKTTLLHVLAGNITPESGEMIMSASSMAWLRQEATAGSTDSVMEVATSEMCAAAAQRELMAATTLLETATDAAEIEIAMKAYEQASEMFESCGGYDMEQKAVSVLKGLSFTQSDFDRPCSELSGGWQMKVALARALLKGGDLLLLDEPTNHMDASAKTWLASYIAQELPSETTLIVVTHDRSLLDKMRLNTVVEISEKRIMKFNVGSIDQWKDERTRLGLKLGKEIKELQAQILEDQAWVNKWGAKAAFASKAQSRLKGITRMKSRVEKLAAMVRGLPKNEVFGEKGGKKEEEEMDGMLPLADMGNVALHLPEPPLARGGPLDGVLLRLEEAAVGYSPERTVLGGVNIQIRAGTRVALVGPNGAGKTTLLRSLVGSMDVQTGKRTVGVGPLGEATVQLFTQDLAQDLPADVSPVEYVLANGGSEEVARAALGALGLKSAVHKSKIGTLSGGEKARVALAVFATTPTDVLLLDEPTNHLDRVAVTALAAGLRAHNKGAVLVSTHDDAFIKALEVTDKAIVTKSENGTLGSLQMVSNTIGA